jgi:Uma2 family endonuclease
MSTAHVRKLEWGEEETPMAFPAPKRLLSDDDLQTMEKTGIVPPGRHFELIRGEVYERDRSGLHKHLFGVDEYQRMGEVGILSDDERVELIRGEIYEMAAIGNPHAMCVMRLIELLVLLLVPRAWVNPQNPLPLIPAMSEPQPDVTVLRRRDFTMRPPGPEDAYLVIEVCDSSLSRDRKKLPLYATSGIPEVWLADLNSETVFVYRHPTPEGYPDPQEYRRGQTISPLAFPGFSVSVDLIFG